MEKSIGQEYTVNVFGRGVAQDLMHDLPIGQVRDTYIEAEKLSVSHKMINALSAITGDENVHENFISSANTMYLIAMVEMNEHLYTFWAVSTGDIWIYQDDTLIGNSPDFPGGYPLDYLYLDTNPDSNEIAITDNIIEPIVLDMDNMYDLRATTTYNTDYDSSLYSINQDAGLTQPRFVELSDLGSGGGVPVGAYSYAYRLVSENGDETPWGPPTPFIPVPVSSGGFSGDAAKVWPGAKLYGSAPSLTGSKYGITIKIRATNDVGFDFLEVKRIANKVGGPVDYTASAEYIRYPDRITGVDTQIITFTDIAELLWAPLDESNTVVNSIIDTARTVRFYDGRLVLGGVKYKSVSFSTTSLFTKISNALYVDPYGMPFKEDLGIGGYKNIYNQVYKKSYRLGEKYGFAITPWDLTGNSLYAVGVPDFNDYQFPDRRDEFPAGEASYSDGEIEAATINTYGYTHVDKVYEVYGQGTTQKSDTLVNIGSDWNVLIDVDASGSTPILAPYSPLSPTGRDAGYAGNGNDSKFHSARVNTELEGAYSYSPDNFGHSILGTGMKLGGVDVSQFPSHVSGFSVNRTKPAGRVVTQGLAMYALTEHDGTALTKAIDKVWLHLPETDPVYGDKTSLYEDIKNNPGDYEMQLVSPVGFNSEVYSGYQSQSPVAWGKQDMVSYANCYYAGGNTHPMDSDAQVGRGDGYPTFGRWRNASQQGSGIDSTLTFTISAAGDPDISGKNGRGKFLEVTLSSNIYYYGSNIGSTNANDTNSRNFHEPWYVVNIVKNGRSVPQNNINLFQEIGQYIKLRSIVGIGNGDEDQTYELVSERRGDVYSANGYINYLYMRYIYVDGNPWLDVTNVASGTIATYLTVLESSGSFTPSTTGAIACYGMYDVALDENDTTITFPHVLPTSSDPVCPLLGDRVEVRYNNVEYIDVWGGDVVIDEVPVGVIDCQTSADWLNTTAEQDEHFRISAAMPAYSHLFNSGHHFQPKNSIISTYRFESGYTVLLQYMRQWMATFMMESTVNIPFVYKDFFPHRNYVMRPMKYDERQDTETVAEYLTDLNIHSAYNTDYPDEYLNWSVGGFHFPSGYNFDYMKSFGRQYGSNPSSGYTEVLDYPKRLHWSAKQSASRYGLGFINTFLSTNIYDTTLKNANEINILYDQYTGKGNNLYAITDRGVIGFITDKQILRDGVGDDLGIILSDSGFVQAEMWLDQFVGSPDKRWRGRAEGPIRTSENRYVQGLLFIGDDDVHMLSGNSVISLGTNFRTTLMSTISGITDYSTVSAAIDPGRNELWLIVGTEIYVYSFSVNNWVSLVNKTNARALTGAKVYDGSRMVRLGVTTDNDGTHTANIFKSDTGFDFDSADVSTGTPAHRPSVTFAATPSGASQFEFTDMFINSSTRPYSVECAIDENFTDPFTILAASIKDIDNLYRFTIGVTTAAKRLIANTLYVRVTFQANADVNIGYVRTGYKKVVGA